MLDISVCVYKIGKTEKKLKWSVDVIQIVQCNATNTADKHRKLRLYFMKRLVGYITWWLKLGLVKSRSHDCTRALVLFVIALLTVYSEYLVNISQVARYNATKPLSINNDPTSQQTI